MRRVEFTKKVRLEIFLRAGGPNRLVCEGCGLPLNGKAFEVDHCVEEWERGGYSPDRKPLTAEDGKLLGKACCHLAKSNKKKAEKAHGDRIIAKAAGVRKKSSWRKKPDEYKFDWRKGKYVRAE